MPQEIEVYFPHDGIYIDASIQNWTRNWKLTCTWQHTRIGRPIEVSEIPTDTESLKAMAIACYEKHHWQHRLQTMEADTRKV